MNAAHKTLQPPDAPPARAKSLRPINPHHAEPIEQWGALVSLRTERDRRLNEGAALEHVLDKVCLVSRRCLAGWCGVDERVVRDWCKGLRAIPPSKVERMRSVGVELAKKLEAK